MKTIVVANQKGGIGKTTVARHLGFFGMWKNLRVLMVDFDVQGNLTTSADNIAEENGMAPARDAAGSVIRKPGELVASAIFDPANNDSPIYCGENLWLIPSDSGIVGTERSDLDAVIAAGQARFKKLSEDYDVCVIDTGPAVSNLLIIALSVADFAVSPCKPDRDAIAGLMGFFSNVTRVTDSLTGANPKLASLGVLPNQISKERAYHRDVLLEMRSLWGTGVLPVALYERAAIDLAKDRAVWRTSRGESRAIAAREMKEVCECIYQRMGL